MDFKTSVKTVLTEKFAEFSGRASRSEFWWFFLFSFIVSIIANVIAGMIGAPLLATIVSLAFLIPSIAVGVRRLHDRDMSGWWYLIVFVPLIGAIVLLVLFIMAGTAGPNRFGEDPVTA